MLRLNELVGCYGVFRNCLMVMSVAQDACKEAADDLGFAPQTL